MIDSEWIHEKLGEIIVADTVIPRYRDRVWIVKSAFEKDKALRWHNEYNFVL